MAVNPRRGTWDASSRLADVAAAFLSTKEDKTRGDYARYLRWFDEATGGVAVGAALTLANADKFIRSLKASRGVHSARNATMTLKSLSTWLREAGVLATSDGNGVFDRLRAPKALAVRRASLTEDEVKAIWQAIAARPARERPRDMAAVRLLSVLKRGQVRLLQLNDLEFDANGTGGWARVRSHRKEIPPLRIDEETGAALQQYFNETRPTFNGRPPETVMLTETGRPFTTYGWSTFVDRLSQHIKATTGIKWSSEQMRRTHKEWSAGLFRDSDLRVRCGPLLSGASHFDQAVAIACQVLEGRVREAVSPPPSERSGVRLMKYAFGSNPRLRLADDETEQRGAMEMFSELMTFYRNPAIHELGNELDRAEAVRIITWVDQLLTLVARAELSGP